jgi:tetratricopeptide (TPR) repeat protein
VLEPAKKVNSTLKILATSEVNSPGNVPVSITIYSAPAGDGKTVYSVRGFVATGDICGDLELYSNSSITGEDAVVKKIFASYRFDPTYAPQFDSALLYAQVLYQAHMYKASGPMFEIALTKISENPALAAKMMGNEKTARRVVTDQAGMSYGMSGNIQKARSIFENGIVEDPDYPMYYYNLACADAEEKNLVAAKGHLQQAFARKANVVSGESMPDPTKDDSFLPYRNNKEFWAFLEGLQAK